MTTRARTPTIGRFARLLSSLDRHPSRWLLLGVLLIAASQLRFGVGLLAWIAPLPFLRHARITSGWRARLALSIASLAAWVLALSKIITEPVPLVFAVLFALPLAAVLTPPYLVLPLLRRRLGEGAAILTFGASMVAGEWALHAALPFGTWGSAANTQLEQLALLQLASVTGIHGVSFLVYVVAASLESLLDTPSRPRAVHLAAALGAVALVIASGEVRLALATAAGTERVRAAAIGTDSTVGAGPLPGAAELAALEAGLFERTRAAARAGAAIVVWTEAAHMVLPEDERAFLTRAGDLARREDVTVVAGYVVPLSRDPLRYANRYALLTPEGAVDHVYDKHHPVPGEPAMPGIGPLPLYEHPELGRVSGAICYDYDFPRVGLAHARIGADLIALPSSDWRGIDPIHTQMAAVRAIEGGFSIVRSTRFGLSAGIDPYGRTRGWLSHWDEGDHRVAPLRDGIPTPANGSRGRPTVTPLRSVDRVLVVSLPRRRVPTLYGVLGDWFPLASAGFAALAVLAALVRRSRWYAARRWPTTSSPSPPAPPSRPASGSASTEASS